jgi:hypothetical protein
MFQESKYSSFLQSLEELTIWTTPDVLLTHALITVVAGGLVGNALARSMVTAAVRTRAVNASGFQLARIE